MKRIGIVGLCLIAAFAMSATAATTASAIELPYLLQCAKVAEAKTGNWEDTKCTKAKFGGEFIRVFTAAVNAEEGISCQKVAEKETGRYRDPLCAEKMIPGEYVRTAPAHLLVRTGGPVFFETANGKTMECKELTGKGEFTGSKTVGKLLTTFKGCKSGLTACNSPKAGAEEIKTTELEGEIGYISKAGKTVGLDVWPSSRTKAEKEKNEFKAVFAEFECAVLFKNVVRGGVVGQLTPVNTMSKTPELTFTQEKGIQKLTKLEGVEGGAKNVLENSVNGEAFETIGESVVEKITTEDASETAA
jgi:hypothetical protein